MAYFGSMPKDFVKALQQQEQIYTDLLNIMGKKLYDKLPALEKEEVEIMRASSGIPVKVFLKHFIMENKNGGTALKLRAKTDDQVIFAQGFILHIAEFMTQIENEEVYEWMKSIYKLYLEHKKEIELFESKKSDGLDFDTDYDYEFFDKQLEQILLTIRKRKMLEFFPVLQHCVRELQMFNQLRIVYMQSLEKMEKKIELFEELKDINKMSSEEVKEATEKEQIQFEKNLKESKLLA